MAAGIRIIVTRWIARMAPAPGATWCTICHGLTPKYGVAKNIIAPVASTTTCTQRRRRPIHKPATATQNVSGPMPRLL